MGNQEIKERYWSPETFTLGYTKNIVNRQQR